MVTAGVSTQTGSTTSLTAGAETTTTVSANQPTIDSTPATSTGTRKTFSQASTVVADANPDTVVRSDVFLELIPDVDVTLSNVSVLDTTLTNINVIPQIQNLTPQATQITTQIDITVNTTLADGNPSKSPTFTQTTDESHPTLVQTLDSDYRRGGMGDTFADGETANIQSSIKVPSNISLIALSDITESVTFDTIQSRRVLTGWLVNGNTVRHMVDAETTHDTLEVVWVTERWNILRGIRRNAGFYDKTLGRNGEFRYVLDFNGASEWRLKPPTHVRPIFEEDVYVADDYNEKNLDRGGNLKEIEATFRRMEPQDNPDTVPQENKKDDNWSILGTDDAILSLSRVEVGSEERVSKGAELIELTFVPNPEQAKYLRRSLQRVEATDVRKISRGRNYAVDNTSQNLNTFYLEPPSDQIRSGYYIVTDWSLSWQGDSQSRMSLKMYYKFSGEMTKMTFKTLVPEVQITNG